MVDVSKQKKPDYVLYNGNIISMDNNGEEYSAIEITEGKISKVYRKGDCFPKRAFGTKVIDLKGKTVLPGFIDSNIHMVQSGLLQYCVEIEADTKESFLKRLKEKTLQFGDGELVWCVGFDENTIDVTRWDLDKVSSNHPIVVSKTEFHKTVVNTTAYNMLSIPMSVDGVQRDERGMPTGVLQGEASGFARRKIYVNFVSDELRRQAVRDVEIEALQYGITTVNAMEGGAFFSNRDIDIVNDFAKDSTLDILLFPQTLDTAHVMDMELPRIGGNIYLDGSIGSKAAALNQHYVGCQSQGSLYYSQDDVNNFVLEAHSAGLQIALSCIGPRAIEQALLAFSSAFETIGKREHRHRIELFVLPTAEQIKRAVELGLVLSMRSNYDYLWGGDDGMYMGNIGNQWEGCNPIGEVIKQGGIVSGGSEYSVTPLSPMISIQSCVLHHKDSQRISVYEAIKTYTVNGAYANFAEDRIGRIKEGLAADLVILQENPMEVPAEQIKDISVETTIKNGKVAYSKEAAIWK